MEFLKSVREKYDLVFLDPPYQTDLLETAIAHIGPPRSAERAWHDDCGASGGQDPSHPCLRPTAWAALTAMERLPSPFTTGTETGEAEA